MRLEEALKIAEAECILDGNEVFSLSSSFRISTGVAIRRYNSSQLIIAYATDDFCIVHEDSFRVVTRNPFAYDSLFNYKIDGFDDWMPLVL